MNNEGKENEWTFERDIHDTAYCFYRKNDFIFKAAITRPESLCDYLNENTALMDALDKIAYPIKHLQDLADKEGAQLNGMMAIMITNDPNWSRNIAKSAIDNAKHLTDGKSV
jgi:hypothetical protein